MPQDDAAQPRAATVYEWWGGRVDLSAAPAGVLVAAGGLLAAQWLQPAPKAAWDAARITKVGEPGGF